MVSWYIYQIYMYLLTMVYIVHTYNDTYVRTLHYIHTSIPTLLTIFTCKFIVECVSGVHILVCTVYMYLYINYIGTCMYVHVCMYV